MSWCCDPARSRVAELVEVGEGLFGQTLAHFRSGGRNQEECVVYWTASLKRPDHIDGLLHPDHSAGPGGYELSGSWLAGAWSRLGHQQRLIRAQVHTHPRRAFHSTTDDRFPIVSTPGFLSLVLPRFAQPPQTLEDAYLACLGADGRWSRVEIGAALQVGVL
jgi:hypothetical protein